VARRAGRRPCHRPRRRRLRDHGRVDPAANGVITGCYRKTTGALRVIDSGKACASTERKLTWNQTGPAGPPAAPTLDGIPCAVNGATGVLGSKVDPTTAQVTMLCVDRITVAGSVPLTRISIRSGPLPKDPQECKNPTSCTARFPLFTPSIQVEIAGTSTFHYTCPGQTPQMNYYDVTHTVTLGQCALGPSCAVARGRRGSHHGVTGLTGLAGARPRTFHSYSSMSRRISAWNSIASGEPGWARA
jgi:hypothetical protein